MASDSVWVSTVRTDSRLVRGLDFDRSGPAWVAINEGMAPAADDLPLMAYGSWKGDRLKNLPPLFTGGGGTKLSAQVAAPMLKFDLGRTLLLPVRMFLQDRETEVGADPGYYTIPRWHVFEALAPEESPNLQPKGSSRPPTFWSLPWTPKDGDVAVHATALDPPAAIWFDPQLMNGIFLSGNLVAALKEAGVAKYWKLKRCRVV